MNMTFGFLQKTAALVCTTATLLAAQGTIAKPVNITATDWNGVKYNIDSLLDAGKVFAIHQTFAG